MARDACLGGLAMQSGEVATIAMGSHQTTWLPVRSLMMDLALTPGVLQILAHLPAWPPPLLSAS